MISRISSTVRENANKFNEEEVYMVHNDSNKGITEGIRGSTGKKPIPVIGL